MHPKRIRSLKASLWRLSPTPEMQAAGSQMGQQRSLHTSPSPLLTLHSHRAKGKGPRCLEGICLSRQAAARSQIRRCTQLVSQGPLRALWGPQAGSRLWPGGGRVHQAGPLQAWTPAARAPLPPTAALPAAQPSQLWLQRTRPAGARRLPRALSRRDSHRQLGSCRRQSRAASSAGGLAGAGRRHPRQPLPWSRWHNQVQARF